MSGRADRLFDKPRNTFLALAGCGLSGLFIVQRLLAWVADGALVPHLLELDVFALGDGFGGIMNPGKLYPS
jgi:hypothetical protein